MEIYNKKGKLLFTGEKKDLEGVNLTNANLEGADLEGANLRKANLRNINLRNINLFNANLRNANLENANLRNANLEGADLEGANLENANLRNANLRNINLFNANLENANLEGAKYSYINILKIFINTKNADLILDLTLWDVESCGIEKINSWIETNICPFSNSQRDFYFLENKEIWKNRNRDTKKYKTLKELFLAVAEDLNIKI